jgi:XapX domain-containing protein
MAVNAAAVALALCTGLLAGALFASLRIPIPAPPNLAGVMGIVGIYLGYRVVNWLGVGVDLLEALGIGS